MQPCISRQIGTFLRRCLGGNIGIRLFFNLAMLVGHFGDSPFAERETVRSSVSLYCSLLVSFLIEGGPVVFMWLVISGSLEFKFHWSIRSGEQSAEFYQLLACPCLSPRTLYRVRCLASVVCYIVQEGGLTLHWVGRPCREGHVLLCQSLEYMSG